VRVAIAIALAISACGPKPAPTGPSPNDAVVFLASNVSDAQVYVDGRFVGPLSVVRRGIAFDPGKHRVELRHDDYFSRFVELDLRRAEKKQVALDMAPVLP
jgi:hypothetical protein